MYVLFLTIHIFVLIFLSILNFQHNYFKITMEKVNKTLNFLDVEIDLNNVVHDTCVW